MSNALTRRDVIDKISAQAFRNSIRALKTSLMDLVEANDRLRGIDAWAFQNGGKLYLHPNTHKPNKTPVPLLSPELREEFAHYREEAQRIDKEKSMALGYLQRMLMVSTVSNQWCELLPDQLHSTVRYGCPLDDLPLKSMSDAELAQFKESNSKYLASIKREMARNFFTGN